MTVSTSTVLALAATAVLACRIGFDPRDEHGIDARGDSAASDGHPDGVLGQCSAATCPGTCVNNECGLDCGANACQARILCPPNVPCIVSCSGQNSCAGGVDCGQASECTIVCSGQNSCGGSLDCATTGRCSISCIGTSACQGPIDGGIGEFSASCANQGTCGGVVDCSTACACDVTCNGMDSCGGAVSCPRPECAYATGCSTNDITNPSCPPLC